MVEFDINEMMDGVKNYFEHLNQLEQIALGLIVLGLILLIVGFIIGV